jgi:signal transduction histidine kinase
MYADGGHRYSWSVRSSDLKRHWDTAWPVLLVLVPGLLGTREAGDDQTGWTRAPDLAAHALVVAAAAVTVVARSHPVVTSVGCGVALTAYFGFGYPVGPILVALPIAAASVAAALPLRRALWCNGALGLAVHLAGAVHHIDAGFGVYLGWLTLTGLMVGVPTAVAAAVRTRRLAEADLRQAHAMQAVSEERLRMAQELHDSVGHDLAVIAMQAGVALHVMERDPAGARKSLTAVQEVSRQALHGLRVQVGALREPDGDGAYQLGCGLADAVVLVERLRAGGLCLTVVGDLHPVGLPERVDTTAYRILQEALTNVLRHAGATQARVRVAVEDGSLLVEVTDAGAAHAATVTTDGPARQGNGIAGMRERAQALGGRLAAGPLPSGGFTVVAHLPLRDAS